MRLSAKDEAELLAKGAASKGVNVAALFPDEPFEPIRLTLPMPPTINHYWVHLIIKGKPRIGLSKIGSGYRKNCEAAIVDQGVPPTARGRISLHAVVHPSDRRRFDLDNRLKPLLDALVHCGVIGDDSLIDRLSIHRGPVGRERVEVSITPLEAA